jgi:hypothetical protein
MRRGIVVIKETGTKVYNWCQAHFDAGPRFVALVDRLGILLARVEVLLTQQINGTGAVSRAVRRRSAIVRTLVGGPLKHLMRIARAASERVPGVDRHFRLPDARSQQAILSSTRSMLAEVEKERGLFQEYGVTDEMLA